jgi:hypothetical protein
VLLPDTTPQHHNPETKGGSRGKIQSGLICEKKINTATQEPQYRYGVREHHRLSKCNGFSLLEMSGILPK